MTERIDLDPDRPDLAESVQSIEEYVWIDNEFARIDGVLRKRLGGRSSVVVIQTHPRRTSAMNLSAWPCRALVGCGFDTFAYNNRATNSAAGTEVITIWEDLALDVAAAVAEMRRRGYEYVVLYGHSAGGPLVSYYQNVAENGNAALNGDAALSRFSGYIRRDRDVTLPPADGLILQNTTTGTGFSFLMRLDGSIVDEERGIRDPQLDPFSDSNGFDAQTGEAHYDAEFRRTYAVSQAARMNRLIEVAQQKLARCRSGAGSFLDDELIVIRGIRGELSCVDLDIASRTQEPHTVFPGEQRKVVTSKRRVVPHYALRNARFRDGGTVHTMSSFLSYRAIRSYPGIFDPEAVTPQACGVDLASTHSTTSANLSGTNVPLLITASTSDSQVHLPSAELAFNAAVSSADRYLAFVEGAEHDMTPVGPEYGDTRQTHIDLLAQWLGERYARADRG